MDMDKQLETLAELVQLDVDAVGTYDAALRRVTDAAVHERLSAFRADHLRHIERLNALVVRMGGQRVDGKTDFKGMVLERFTAVSAWMGTEGALIAMVGNEELTNRRYEAALQLAWTAEAQRVIERNHEDERRHLAWIKAELHRRTVGTAGEEAHP